jgi:D-alanine-D-alanine ligase
MMEQYDCVVLFNAAIVTEKEGSQEHLYPANMVREEVLAIAESLKQGGYCPYVLSVDCFSGDVIQTLLEISPKFVFNLCEEINGKCEQEMCFAGLLELMGIPYTGSDSFALGLALNKFHVKQALQASGIPTARGCLVFPGHHMVLPKDMRFPMIVKPAREDASLGINSDSVCHSVIELNRQVKYIHDVYKQEALIEEYLDGREFNVSVIGAQDPRVLAISEIDFTGFPENEPKIVSYRAKWDEESTHYGATTPICPANISKELEAQIQDMALSSYLCVGCRDYARIDMRTDLHGVPHVLEVNPNPDISPKAGFARAARAAGYSFPEIILQISKTAIARGASQTPAVYAF